MKKIIVAGAGHGGISAAAFLAKNGFEVTVYEKKKREELGYDWCDCMRKSTFEETEIPIPDLSVFSPMERRTYSNPKKSVRIIIKEPPSDNIVYIDRKILINYLIDYAEKCGVKFCFECEVLSAVCDKEKVSGVAFLRNGKCEKAYADLVIAADGMNSPVRKSLPQKFGIQKEIPYENIFSAWRGYCKRTENTGEDEYDIYFYHCNRPGMDWAIRKDGYYDVLVGKFGELCENEVKMALDGFNKDYPDMTNDLVRGGSFGKIPLGRVLPVLVCDGCALVGDSAAMTEPLSGSGIDLSLLAGKILADTVLKCDDMKKETLWEYNYRFFKEHAEKYYNDAVIKSFLSVVSAKDIDFLFENRIMTQKEISGGSRTKYSPKELMEKASLIKNPRLILSLSDALKGLNASKKAKKLIPEKYSEKEIEKFKETYSKL